MLATIGLMVGCYIEVRLFEIITDRGKQKQNFLSVCAVIASIVVFICLVDLILGSSNFKNAFTPGL